MNRLSYEFNRPLIPTGRVTFLFVSCNVYLGQQKWLKIYILAKMDTWWLNRGESKNILVVVNRVITVIGRSKEMIVVMYRLNHWSDQYFHSYCKMFLCILCNLLCILIRVSYMTLYCTLSCRHNWLILIVHQVQGKQSLLWVSFLSSISTNPSLRDQVQYLSKRRFGDMHGMNRKLHFTSVEGIKIQWQCLRLQCSFEI